MKKLISLILAVLLLALPAAAEPDALPAYEYTGSDTYTGSISQWLLDHTAEFYSGGDVAIPCPQIIAVEDDNPDDILVWGNFGLNRYSLINTTLFCESGGMQPGLMHLAKTDDGYSVVSFDGVQDGSDFDIDVRRIFGMREGLLGKYYASSMALSATRLQFISDYVNHNMLPITQMQDFGWAPMPLINTPDTAEADQIVHFTSAMGYSLDYDLRLFSYMYFDETTEDFSGVGPLAGISVMISRTDKAADDILSELSADMAQPVQETVPIGADAQPVIRLRDAALREDVHNYHYVIPMDGGCLLVSSSNTGYAVSGDPVVPDSDAALEALLSTIQIKK